jgi:hypothetical protein
LEVRQLPTAAEYENKIQLMHWAELRSLWDNIEQRDTVGWEPGKAFEYLVLRAFQLDGADVKFPYSVKLFEEEIEQIDGVIYFGGLSCLVESKDLQDNTRVAMAPIAKLRNQLLRRPAGVIGLVFSRTGFTQPAISLSRFSLSQSILLWNGEEIQYALAHERICELLILKYRACVEYALSDHNIIEETLS